MNYKSNLVSIIMTTHNCEKIVKPTIQSIINQSYPNWELIIVDDFSSDNTVQICKKLLEGKINQPFQILRNEENKNVSFSRNRGIKQSQGRYLAFIDHDDIWLNQKIEKQISFHQKNKVFLSHTYYRHFNKKSQIGHLIKSKDFLEYSDLLKINSIALSSVMIDREIANNFFFISEHEKKGVPQEDFRTWLSYSKKKHQLRIIKEDLMRYFYDQSTYSSNKYSMAKQRWHVLRDLEKISFFNASYFFIIYFFKSFNKYYLRKILNI